MYLHSEMGEEEEGGTEEGARHHNPAPLRHCERLRTVNPKSLISPTDTYAIHLC